MKIIPNERQMLIKVSHLPIFLKINLKTVTYLLRKNKTKTKIPYVNFRNGNFS